MEQSLKAQLLSFAENKKKEDNNTDSSEDDDYDDDTWDELDDDDTDDEQDFTVDNLPKSEPHKSYEQAIKDRDFKEIFAQLRNTFRPKPDDRGVPIELHTQEAHHLRKELKLGHCLTRPITAQEVMKVGGEGDHLHPPKSANKVSHSSTLNWIKQLLMLNYEARDCDIVMASDGSEPDTEIDDFFADENDSAQSNIHPMDHLLMVFLSCDDTLQQLLVKNLFSCRLAIPFVIPNYNINMYEIVLNALYRIVLECSMKDGSNLESPALEAPCHVLSMVRLGALHEVSKSNILNHFLDSKGHPTFVHWNCKNGSCKREISSGMVELSWFLPRNADSQHDLTAVLNLRGDALNNKPQFDLTKSISNVLICMIDYEIILSENVLAAIQTIPTTTHVMFVLNLPETYNKSNYATFKGKVESRFENNSIVSFSKTKNIISAVDKIHKTVNELMEGRSTSSKLVLNSLASKEGWAKDSTKFELEFYLASKIMTDLNTSQMNEMKRNNFPLQGDIWCKLSKLMKEGRRTEAEPQDKDEAKSTAHDKDVCRLQNQQVIRLQSCTEATLKSIAILNSDAISRMQCLAFLGHSLNALCREKLPELYAKSRMLWLETRKDPSKRSELLEVEETLRESSVGMEHLFRELSQLYQVEQGSTGAHVFSLLPSDVASLIIEGYPFEILDGDAGNISLDWIKDVMHSIAARLGNSKIVVVSVLGIQSSGKSTLLNTMFGLQFAVSAGRCTKGAFMQLVKAEKEQSYEYILVLDTEGLRSAELAEESKDRDNEIATFVIGIGDVTIINIKGENYAEMKDVIQIAVHAFFRMSMVHKNMDMNKRCLFIHQNSPAANAKSKNSVASRQLQEALDDITKEAAQQENITNVTSFNQIIAFDCEKDIWYFPDLWQGTPPMAYTNPEYSSQALDVRRNIVSRLCSQDGGQLKTIKYFAEYIKDLWDAILCENFVFRFQNCLHIKSFQMLETECHRLVSEFSKKLCEWEHEKFAEVAKCKSIEEISEYTIKMTVDMKEKIRELREQAENDLQQFCNSNPNASIVLQWMGNKMTELLLDLDTKATQWRYEIEERMKNQTTNYNAIKKEKGHRENLMNRVYDIAETKRDELDNPVLIANEFDLIWEEIYPESKVVRQKSEVTGFEVKKDVVKELNKVFVSHRHNLEIALKSAEFHESSFCDPNMDMIAISDIKDEHLSMAASSDNTHRITSSDNDWQTYCQSALDFINADIRGQMTRFLDNIPDETSYTTTIIYDFINAFLKLFKKDITHDKIVITLLPALQTKISVIACEYAFPKFCQLYNNQIAQQAYNEEMRKFKERMKNYFADCIQNEGANEENMVKSIIRNLENILVEHCKKYVDGQVQEKIVQRFRTKSDLLSEMLKHLAHIKNVKEYVAYFSDARKYAIVVLQAYSKTVLDHEGSTICAKTIDEIHSHAKKWFDSTTDNFDKNDDIKATDWADKFWSCVRMIVPPQLVTPDQQPANFTVRNSKSLKKHFSHHLTEALRSVRTKLIDEVAGMSDATNRNMFDQVVAQIWGCTEKCPFCQEPCCKAMNHTQCDMSHTCMSHRPEGTVREMCDRRKNLKLEDCSYKMGRNWLTQPQFKLGGKKHKYKTYQKYFPHWLIEKSGRQCDSVYWQWVMATLGQELASEYSAKPPKVPKIWKNVTEVQAIRSLES